MLTALRDRQQTQRRLTVETEERRRKKLGERVEMQMRHLLHKTAILSEISIAESAHKRDFLSWKAPLSICPDPLSDHTCALRWPYRDTALSERPTAVLSGLLLPPVFILRVIDMRVWRSHPRLGLCIHLPHRLILDNYFPSIIAIVTIRSPTRTPSPG